MGKILTLNWINLGIGQGYAEHFKGVSLQQPWQLFIDYVCTFKPILVHTVCTLKPKFAHTVCTLYLIKAFLKKIISNYLWNCLFLSDLGKPGVRSLGPDVCPSVREWVRDVVQTLLMWLWLLKIPNQYWLIMLREKFKAMRQCKWCRLLQVVPSGGQFCNWCKRHHLVAKFLTNASGGQICN